MLVEASCQFFDSGLHPVIHQAFQEVSEKTIDQLLKVIFAIVLGTD